MKCLLFIVALLAIPALGRAEEKTVPRTLVALYDGRENSTPRPTSIHRFLEMPANHLGYDIRYYDVNAPLPQLGDEVRGIVLWFSPGNSVPDAKIFLDWLEAQVTRGKKLLILENAGIGDKERRQDSIMQQYNRILSHIGIQDGNQWNAVTYRTRVEYIDPVIAGFERQIGPVLPPFGDMHIIPGKALSHLKMTVRNREEDEVVDLIITSPRGGFVADGYTLFEVIEDNESKIVQWFINPFEFLKRSLGEGFAPVPDITTLNGRRIFYSHIDGDGWNNITEIEQYSTKKMISAEVIQKEILEPYKDFAFTVGLIISDIDTQCYGLETSEKVARDIYALPNVEPSSHTHSHPLFWRYFANYTPEKEEPLLSRYPEKPKNKSSMMEDIKDKADKTDWKESAPAGSVTIAVDHTVRVGSAEEDEEASFTNPLKPRIYDKPRSYACTPFVLDQEISGSIARVNSLSPPGKKAKLIQWSGDTSPFEAALKATREGGFYNINGGDSRFDREYPSYASVAPIGLHLGNELQIYSSNSNENTYTNLWTGRFFGFRYLQTTVQNTETPIRILPFNIYFHIYSGQKLASLNAVRENLEFARSQKIIPITTSHYTAIANGFYTSQISKLGDNEWSISNRGALGTLRFDNAEAMSVDFSASKGVWGQDYANNSLYIHLDPGVAETNIKLKNNKKPNSLPIETTPYLVDSRWEINTLQIYKNLLTIHALGYGTGEMTWIMPESGNYLIQARPNETAKPVFEKSVAVGVDGVLHFTIDIMSPTEPLLVTIEKK